MDVHTVLFGITVFIILKDINGTRVYIIEPVNNLYTFYPSHGKIYNFSNYQYFMSTYLSTHLNVPHYQIIGRKVYIHGELVYESAKNTVPNIIDGRIYVNDVMVYDPFTDNPFIDNVKIRKIKESNAYSIRNGKVYIEGKFVYQAPPYAFVTVKEGKVFLDGQVVYDSAIKHSQNDVVRKDKPISSIRSSIFDFVARKTIDVKNGQIFINGNLVYDNVPDLMSEYPKEVRCEKAKLFINDKLVLKENRAKSKLKLPKFGIWRVEGSQYSGISSFELKTCKNGSIRYIDNKKNLKIFEPSL